MLSKDECYKARSKIETLSILEDDTVAISTQTHGAKIFSPENCSALKNLSIDFLCHQTTAVAFSKSSNLLAIANHRVIYIVNTQNKTLIQTIYTNEGEIQIISFVPNTKYLVTGTKNGRVLQYRYDGRAHLSRLCSFGQTTVKKKLHLKNNYVSAFAFKENLFASTGYGGVITILKMSSYINRYTITSSKVQINALCFLNDNRIVSGNIEGFIQIHSLKKHQATKTIPTNFRHINNIILMPNSRHIMVSAQSRNIILIDTVLEKVVANSYLTFKENVLDIALTQDYKLFVSLENNELHKIELPTAQDLKTLLFENRLDKAYKLIEMDPMLHNTREHIRVEVMYEKLYSQAVEALINSQPKEARKLIQMFTTIPSKYEELSSIFKAFEYYPKFKNFYLEKKYTLAYAVAEKHPPLKRTHQFKRMEEIFKEAFSFAQKQILIGREDIARDTLSGYSTISSKKAIVKLLLNQNRDFLAFLKAINEKNYTLVEKLLNRHPIFSQIPTFSALKNSTDNSLDEIRGLLDAGDVDRAVDMIKQLKNTPGIKDQLQELYKDSKLIHRLQDSYNKSDFQSCYEILDSSYSLGNLELAQLLEKHWAKLINTCEESALKGDIKSIKETLGELIHVKSRVDKIGDLLRLSFHMKIKGLMAKRNFKSAENIIYSYIDIFGKDSEIIVIMSLYEKTTEKKLAITHLQESKLSRDSWLKSPIIMG